MIEQITFIVKSGKHDEKTYSTIMFDEWGNPLDNDVRFIKDWQQIHNLKNLKKFIFLCKSGTLFLNISNFFEELKKFPKKFGFGHIIYSKSDNQIRLHDQACLIESEMLPKNFGDHKQISMPNFEISKKNLHHDYTPTFIKIAKGIENKIQSNVFGQDILSKYLNERGMFLNFSRVSRKYKKFLYENDDNHDYFFDYNTMIENTIWIFNNHSFKRIEKEKALMTGAGTDWIWQLLVKNCNSITVCDVSKMQILFVSKIYREWNGKNYGKFVYDFIKKYKIKHFHFNLNEKYELEQDKILFLKNEEVFCNKIDANFNMLFQKYFPNEDFEVLFNYAKKNKKVLIKNADIFEESKNFNLREINLSNTCDFKYNFCNNKIKNYENLLPPATKVFIKKIEQFREKKVSVVPACVELRLDVPVDIIHNEINNIKKYLVKHREHDGIGWRSFCIHGQSYDRTQGEDQYKDFLGYKWTTEAQQQMPLTIEWIKSLKIKNLKRVRVMCLSPRGFINVHKDEHYPTLGPVNIAITHPIGCEFFLENHGLLEFSPGKAYILNLFNYHSVINRGLENRFHIIVHGDTKELLSKKI